MIIKEKVSDWRNDRPGALFLTGCHEPNHFSNILLFDWCPGCNYNTACAEIGCEGRVMRGKKCPKHA